MKVLKKSFFNRDTLWVARHLIGKILVRKWKGRRLQGLIVETEGYSGPNDLASHASRGKTKRTAIMFGPAGYSYIYLIYGMYYCLNIVTEKKDYPAAVLIRAVKIKNYDFKKTNGPGKVCKILKINKTLNETDMTKKNFLWVEDHGIHITKSQIKKTPRIGIDYAKTYKNKLWRFVLEE